MTDSDEIALARSYEGDGLPEDASIDERRAAIKRKMEQRAHARPLCYLASLPRLIEVARQHGYALCVHGSLVRDLDLVAVPWTDQAGAADDLVAAIAEACGGVFVNDGERPAEKPHGRLAWSIHTGAEMYLDLSVMPRQTAGNSYPGR